MWHDGATALAHVWRLDCATERRVTVRIPRVRSHKHLTRAVSMACNDAIASGMTRKGGGYFAHHKRR